MLTTNSDRCNYNYVKFYLVLLLERRLNESLTYFLQFDEAGRRADRRHVERKKDEFHFI